MHSPWLLEPWLQKWRINQIMPHFPFGGVHVDVGCDTPPVLINQVKDRMKQCIGLDIVVKDSKEGNVTIKQQDLQKKIDLPSESADVITLLAVLEHMKYPADIAKECYRILRKNGVILVTVPSPQNKPFLEFAAKVGLVRKEMIDQHENYFTHPQLMDIFKQAGFHQIHISSFELGMNTFLKAVKLNG